MSYWLYGISSLNLERCLLPQSPLRIQPFYHPPSLAKASLASLRFFEHFLRTSGFLSGVIVDLLEDINKTFPDWSRPFAQAREAFVGFLASTSEWNRVRQLLRIIFGAMAGRLFQLSDWRGFVISRETAVGTAVLTPFRLPKPRAERISRINR